MAIWRHYALCDPRIRGKNKRVRYVGRTEYTLEKRFKEHLAQAKSGCQTHRSRWLRKMLREEVEVLIIDLGTGDDSRETELIAWYRARGADLTNATDGGDGVVGYNPPPEVRAKIGAANKQRWTDPEYRESMAAASKEMWTDPDCYDKVFTPEARAKMSADKKRQWRDPERRENMLAQLAAARKKQWTDPERRAKALAQLAAARAKSPIGTK